MAKLKIKKVSRLCIDVSREAHRKLKIYSASSGECMGDILSRLIIEFLEEPKNVDPE